MRHQLMSQQRRTPDIIPFIPPSPSEFDAAQKNASGKAAYEEGRYYQERDMSGSAMAYNLTAQHRDAEEIIPFIPPSPSEFDAAQKKELGQSVYEEGRFYQGTTDVQAADRRANGMDPNHKVGSSVDNGIALGVVRLHPGQVEKFRSNALTHFYFTKFRTGNRAGMGAVDYARLASAKGGRPKVIRAFLTEESSVSLQPDPDSVAGSLAFRTRDKVASGSVLPSKKAPSTVTKASEDFRNRFNKHPSRIQSGIGKIGSREAARMLRDAQSDSEDDFDDAPPRRQI